MGDAVVFACFPNADACDAIHDNPGTEQVARLAVLNSSRRPPRLSALKSSATTGNQVACSAHFLPRHRSSAKHPRTCGPGDRRWERIAFSEQSASSKASARTARRADSRWPDGNSLSPRRPPQRGQAVSGAGAGAGLERHAPERGGAEDITYQVGLGPQLHGNPFSQSCHPVIACGSPDLVVRRHARLVRPLNAARDGLEHSIPSFPEIPVAQRAIGVFLTRLEKPLAHVPKAMPDLTACFRRHHKTDFPPAFPFFCCYTSCGTT